MFSTADTQVKERFMWVIQWGKDDFPKEMRAELSLEEYIELKHNKRELKDQREEVREKSIGI